MTWVPLTADAVADLPGQLGVYEIATGAPPEQSVVAIGYAGGHEPFGLRSALGGQLATYADAWFRVEYTHAYLTRWQELLMRYDALHGVLPPGNEGLTQPLGRLAVPAGGYGNMAHRGDR